MRQKKNWNKNKEKERESPSQPWGEVWLYPVSESRKKPKKNLGRPKPLTTIIYVHAVIYTTIDRIYMHVYVYAYMHIICYIDLLGVGREESQH